MRPIIIIIMTIIIVLCASMFISGCTQKMTQTTQLPGETSGETTTTGNTETTTTGNVETTKSVGTTDYSTEMQQEISEDPYEEIILFDDIPVDETIPE